MQCRRTLTTSPGGGVLVGGTALTSWTLRPAPLPSRTVLYLQNGAEVYDRFCL